MDKPKLVINVNSSVTGEALISCTVTFKMIVPLYDAIKHKEVIAGYIANEMRKFIASVTEDDIVTDPVFDHLEELYEEKRKHQWLD